MKKLPDAFYGRIVLVGTNGRTVPIPIFLGKLVPTTFEYTQAVNAFNQIRAAIAAATDANIQSTEIVATFEVSNELPANADLTEVAVVNVLTTDANGDPGTATLYIPAPSQTLFIGTTGEQRDILDTTDATLVDYVQQWAQHAFVSDGEQIDTSAGYSGINPKNPGGRITKQTNLYKK